MKRLVLISFLLLMSPVLAATVGAQDRPNPTETAEQAIVELELRDGSLLRGTILSESAENIAFRTLGGSLIDIPSSDVVRRRTIEGRMTDDGFLEFDPNSTRLLFGPTARSLRSGNRYIAAHELFLLSGATGIGNSLTLWGGISIVPAASKQLVFVAPKFTLVDRGNKALAAGFVLGTVTGGSSGGGIMYASGTLGGPEQALTLGTGFLFGGGEVLTSPIVMIGAHKQLSSRVKLITENYAMPTEGGGVVMSGALRLIGGRLTSDFGGITHTSALSGSGFPVFPWLSFSYHFSR